MSFELLKKWLWIFAFPLGVHSEERHKKDFRVIVKLSRIDKLEHVSHNIEKLSIGQRT